MDDKERIAGLEVDVREIHKQLDRRVGDLQKALREARDEIQSSREECASGITRLGDRVSEGFKDLRDGARGWVVGAVVMVTGVAGVAVTVIALVVK